MSKGIKHLIFYLQFIMLLFSFIALIFIIIDASKMELDISSHGFQNFLDLFNPYFVLFSATFVVISANVALEKLELQNKHTINSFKSSSRIVWIQTVREFITKISKEDPVMESSFNKKIMDIHDYLFEKNYVINSKNELLEFVNQFFGDDIETFEQYNVTFSHIACYNSKSQMYSFPSFNYLIYSCIKPGYDDILFKKDLSEIYLDYVQRFSGNYIVPVSEYNAAHQSYLASR